MTMEFLWNYKGSLIRNFYPNLNDHGILQGILTAIELFKDFDQNSFQELDDHGILMNLFEDFDQNSGDYEILQELDDHRILMKFFKDFYQNFGGGS